MEISVVNNLASYKAQSSLGAGALSNSLSQPPAGQRLDPTADDPPDLAISERLKNRIRGLIRALSYAFDSAIQKTPGERGRAGAGANRMNHTRNNLAVRKENRIAAESTIRDLNMARAVYSGMGKDSREKPSSLI